MAASVESSDQESLSGVVRGKPASGWMLRQTVVATHGPPRRRHRRDVDDLGDAGRSRAIPDGERFGPHVDRTCRAGDGGDDWDRARPRG